MKDADGYPTAASATDIRRWLAQGKEMGASYVVVKADTFSYEDFPVYVLADQDVRKIAETNENMTKTMEVYDLGMDIEAQLKEDRAWHV